MRLVWALWTVEPVGVASYLIINMLSNFCFLFLKKFDGGYESGVEGRGSE